MAYINLLPWREEAKKLKEKQFYTILGAVALMSLAITLLAGQFYQSRVDGQDARNQYLQQEITKLDGKIGKIKELKAKKVELEKRIAVVQQLQRSRNVGTQVLDEIAKTVPNGVYLTSLEKQGDILQVNGSTESNNHLANMIREIQRSNLLTQAQLASIVSKDEKASLLSDFKMTVKIKGFRNQDELLSAATGAKK